MMRPRPEPRVAVNLDSIIGDTTVVVRERAFVNDVAKTNFAETLKQRGLGNVRSL